MASTLDVDKIERDARKALEESVNARVDSVRDLAASRQAKHDAEAALTAAEAADADAYGAALAAGWTEVELRDLGIESPAGKAAPRARARTGRARSSNRSRSGAGASPKAPQDVPSGSDKDSEQSTLDDGDRDLVGAGAATPGSPWGAPA